MTFKQNQTKHSEGLGKINPSFWFSQSSGLLGYPRFTLAMYTYINGHLYSCGPVFFRVFREEIAFNADNYYTYIVMYFNEANLSHFFLISYSTGFTEAGVRTFIP